MAADHSWLKVFVSLFATLRETRHLVLFVHPSVSVIRSPHLGRDLFPCNRALLECKQRIELLVNLAWGTTIHVFEVVPLLLWSPSLHHVFVSETPSVLVREVVISYWTWAALWKPYVSDRKAEVWVPWRSFTSRTSKARIVSSKARSQNWRKR